MSTSSAKDPGTIGLLTRDRSKYTKAEILLSTGLDLVPDDLTPELLTFLMLCFTFVPPETPFSRPYRFSMLYATYRNIVPHLSFPVPVLYAYMIKSP
jgi:hypothetical protein